MQSLDQYWENIPVGRDKAITYEGLCSLWCCSKRCVRLILQRLSVYDNGDDYILIRSGKGRGFYRTNDLQEIEQYRCECLKKGRSILAPVHKCNRVLRPNDAQFSFANNLRTCRVDSGLTQKDVCERVKAQGIQIDEALLSKFENSVALPPPALLAVFAQIYGVESEFLLHDNLLGLIR